MKKSLKGYTLAEVLMVIFIIALLSSLAINRFDSQRKKTADNVTKANLESIRTALALFYEVEKQWPSTSLSNLLSGAPSGTKYLGAMPKDGTKRSSTVVNSLTGNGGWYYNTSLHEVHPNLLGVDASNVAYSSY